jgi:DNA-binding LacI/PurR family transcriptional regulator
MQQTTIVDIAKLIGVAPSTVSRALNGSHEVGEKTRKLIQDAARKLNYVPNKAALSLLRIKTKTIGVIVPNLSYHYFSAALQGIESEASERGFTVIASQSMESEEKEKKAITDMLRGGVDGVLISLAQYSNRLEHLIDLQSILPVVMFDRVAEHINCSKVTVNNVTGAFSAVNHLAKIGCKRIAYMAGPKDLLISKRRQDGFHMAMYKHHLEIDNSLVIHCEFDHQKALKAATNLLSRKDRPDGIFAVSDRVAIAALCAAKKLNLKVPKQIAIVGFNDEPISSLITPSLSSVSQPAFEMGKTGAKILIDQIEAKSKSKLVIKSFTTKLKIRESTSIKK